MERMVNRLANKARAAGWTAVVSSHEQFGALTAALLAERLGWPGTPVKAVLACQHKLYAREVLNRICPEASVNARLLDAEYGAPIPEGLCYPAFVKPIKAAFSVLAKQVNSQEDLHQHTRFGRWELWVIRHLVEPFERVFQKRLPGQTSAHRLMLEETVTADQFNLDGFVWQGQAAILGVVDAIMYPGTQAFMRWDYPSRLPSTIQQRALHHAQQFLAEVGFDHGLFNMEFFYDQASDKLTIIEFNPRMASQFSDLYQRVDGKDLHGIAVALAHGRHPDTARQTQPTAQVASSLVYRNFDPERAASSVTMPTRHQKEAAKLAFPDLLLMPFPKDKIAIERDFKWLGSYRYAIAHLGGNSWADLQSRAAHLSELLGWPTPYADERINPVRNSKPSVSAWVSNSLNSLIHSIGEPKT